MARKKVSGMKAGAAAEAEAAAVDLGGFSPQDEAQIVKMQAAAKAHVTRVAAAEPSGAAAAAGDSEALGAAAAAAMAGGELPDLSLLTEAEQAAVVKMQASARGYLAGPHRRRPPATSSNSI